MKEHPIIYSTEMVRAYLEGRKTMTRRTYGLKAINLEPSRWEYMRTNNDGSLLFWIVANDPEPDIEKRIRLVRCPYGQVGDSLWVKETFFYRMGSPDAVIYKDGTEKFKNGHIIENFANVDRMKWKPSIHMPRWASRINQTITEIRVERLQDISWQDCRAEGISLNDIRRVEFTALELVDMYIGRFSYLWDSINGKKYLWESNPFCWVISYPRYEG